MVTILPIDDALLLARLNEPLQQLHVQHYPGIYKPFNEADIAAYFTTCLADENYMHFGAYKGDDAIGYIQAQVISKSENAFGYAQFSIHIHQLAVDAGHQRSGAGRLLVDTIRQIAKERDITRIDLTVRDFNEDALAFYKSLGFAVDMLRVWIEV